MQHVAHGLLILLLATSSFAATRTWTGATNGQWTVAANWGGTAPVAGDALIFPAGALTLVTTNDFPAGTAFNSIAVTGSGYGMSGNLINIGAGGLSSSTGSVGIDTPFLLTASQSWTVTGGNFSLDATLNLNSQSLTLHAPAGSGSLDSVVSGSGTIIKTGASDWTLSGGNTFTGQVQVNGGTLFIRDANALGTADNTVSNGTIVNSGGTLNLDAVTYPTELIQLFGGGQGNNGALQSAGNAVLTGIVELADSFVAMNLQAGQSIAFNGVVTGIGRFGMGNSGIYILNNPANNFSGGVVWGATGFPNSTLTLGASNVLPATVAINVGAGGTFNVNSQTQTIASLAGSGTVNLGSGGGGTLTITGGSTAYSGVIAGIGTIIHTGGSLTLTGINTYSGTYSNTNGTTIVNAGALPASYTQSAGALGLSSNGTMGAVTINGGTFDPGSGGTGIGNSGNLTLAFGTTYAEAINGTASPNFDNLHVTGTVNLGNATLILSGTGAGVVGGNTFTIIDNDGADAVTGTFLGLPNGATIIGGPGGLNYVITYAGGSGNDVVLTAAATSAIPALDPRALLALALVLAAIAVIAIRR